MEQAQQQTITLIMPSTDGALASTGSSVWIVITLAVLLILLSGSVFIKRHPAYRHKLVTNSRRFFLWLLMFGIIVGSSNTNVLAAPILSLGVNQNNIQVTVNQGSNVASAATNVSVSTAGAAGYSLTVGLAQAEPGIDIAIAGGQVTENTPLAVGDTPLQIRQTTTATADDVTDMTLTFTIADTVTSGEKQLKLTYIAIDNTVPVVINPAVCRNADPVSGCQVDIDAAMIPITYTGNTTAPEWRKADVDQAGNWYDYQNKQWANAITVNAASLTTYQNAPTNTIIDEADVLAYYVYVPRYEYQVCRPNASDPISSIAASGCPNSTATPYDFTIRFQTPSESTSYDGLTVGGWTTHPAFTFGTAQLAGIWVGKYETSSPDTITNAGTALTAVANGKVSIKPNQNGLNYQNVSTQFATAQSFTNPSAPNYQNLDGSTTDTRMPRDADWGAATYLATSSYGKGAANPVYINNCRRTADWTNYNQRTGWSATTETAAYTTTCAGGDDSGAYHTAIGQQASTTGNTYGLYDMSRGNWELTLGNYNGNLGQSGFSSLPGAKYLEVYTKPPFEDSGWYENMGHCTYATCGGRAIHETKTVQVVTTNTESWNTDSSLFAVASYPWMMRGGASDSGSFTGLFATDAWSGREFISHGFRVVQSRF